MSKRVKLSILSAVAIFLCGTAFSDPVFRFWCGLCEEGITLTTWGNHMLDKHEILSEEPENGFCVPCRCVFSLEQFEHHIGEEKHKALRLQCDCWCPTCKKVIPLDGYPVHLWLEHIKKMYTDVLLQDGREKTDESLSMSEAFIFPDNGAVQCLKCRDLGKYVTLPGACRSDHCEIMHSDLLLPPDLYCGKCKEAVSKNEWNAHVRRKHKDDLKQSIFVCSVCGEITLWNSMGKHTEEKHPQYYCCPICMETVSETRVKHCESMHSESCSRCGCGRFFLCGYEDKMKESREHWRQHKMRCGLCSSEVDVEHMVNEHECGEGCRPIITADKIWQWIHAPGHIFKCPFSSEGCSVEDCKSRLKKHIIGVHKCRESCYLTGNDVLEVSHATSCGNCIRWCPFSESGCNKRGTFEHLKGHVREQHKCTENCGFDAQGEFHHDASFCRYRAGSCPRCKDAVENIAKHLERRHGCRGECDFVTGKAGGEHCFECSDFRIRRCECCSANDVDLEHFRECLECTKECYAEEDKDGIWWHHKCGKSGLWQLKSKGAD